MQAVSCAMREYVIILLHFIKGIMVPVEKLKHNARHFVCYEERFVLQKQSVLRLTNESIKHLVSLHFTFGHNPLGLMGRRRSSGL